MDIPMKTINCDAAHFTGSNRAILGILCEDKAYRIKVRAKNVNVAELLAIMMARKLFGAGRIISDAQCVVNTINNKEWGVRHVVHTVHKGQAKKLRARLVAEDDHELIWMRRRSDERACIVDSLTRRDLSGRFRSYITRQGITLTEVLF
jgi:hypothetical protein